MKRTYYKGYILCENRLGRVAICKREFGDVVKYVNTLSEAFNYVNEKVKPSKKQKQQLEKCFKAHEDVEKARMKVEKKSWNANLCHASYLESATEANIEWAQANKALKKAIDTSRHTHEVYLKML